MGASVLALLAASVPAAAAPKPISGKLSKPGYTVIALAANGKARVVRATSGRFELRPPARSVTLHLRAPNGVYGGPVVVGRKKKSAVVGVRAGARLGRVRVRSGHARVSRRVRSKWIDERYGARARRGVPIGAGRFGRVRSRHVRASVPGDSDLDGIPDLLDVDDDGDLILDRLDRLSATRVARTAADPPDPEQFGFFSSLDLSLDQTANANAAPPGSPLTGQQIDTVLSSSGSLVMDVMPGDALPNSPELDCGGAIQQPPRPEGLVYCRPHSSGGIGRLAGAGGPLFPDCCDPDADGLGTLRPNSSPPPGTPPGMFLHHGATTAQIGTGDLLIQRVTRDGQETAFLAALHYVLATVPAVASYTGENGPPIPVQYPYPPATDPDGPGPSPGRPPPFPVADGTDPGADVEVTLEFWRPQREALPEWGETGDWIDVGRLKYEAQVEHSGRRCPQSAFSEQDPDLALHSSSPIYADHNPGFSDLGPDRPASRANTFTYTLNLTQCLESNGFSFNPGEERGFSFLAVNPNGVDNAQQGVWFKRE